MRNFDDIRNLSIDDIRDYINRRYYIESLSREFSNDELSVLCDIIRKANEPGDKVMLIYLARKYAWWDQNDEDTCNEILKHQSNNKSMIIRLAQKAGWWVYDNQTTIDIVNNLPDDDYKEYVLRDMKMG